ncbi:MAG TPA: ABC transporter ATP-binding protein [Pilimelia sp.]|nr:ABC transporter ATP-binding protein [Pilimelia sp.]
MRTEGRRLGGYVTLLACGIAQVAADLALPTVLGRCVDALVARGPVTGWLITACLLVVAVVVAEQVQILVVGAVVAGRAADLRRRLVRHLLALGPQRARFSAGDLVSRVGVGAADAAHAGPAAVATAVAVLPPLGSVVLLAFIDIRLGVAFLAGIALVGVVLVLFTRRTTEVSSAYQRVQGEIAARLTEALAGIRTIAAAGTEHRERRRILDPLPRLRREGELTWRMLARAGAQTTLLVPLTQVAVLATAGIAVAQGRLTAGELFAASQYALLGAGLGGLAGELATLSRARAGALRVGEVQAVTPARRGERDLPGGPGGVELRGVSLRLGDRTVLHPLSVQVPGGSCLAVVGLSGSGKSRLLDIIACLVAPDTGAVLLDGVPVDELSPAALRRAVGYAFDRPVLVGAPVGDAVGLGAPPPKVRQLARSVRADDFIDRLPGGYDTPLDEAPLSGGEAQRLGLARAVRAERLLLLDDATSHLDVITEAQVERMLRRSGRTRIVVTHRVGAAARADQVLWLDRGRVRGQGSHRQLWRDPDYRAVFT